MFLLAACAVDAKWTRCPDGETWLHHDRCNHCNCDPVTGRHWCTSFSCYAPPLPSKPSPIHWIDGDDDTADPSKDPVWAYLNERYEIKNYLNGTITLTKISIKPTWKPITPHPLNGV